MSYIKDVEGQEGPPQKRKVTMATEKQTSLIDSLKEAGFKASWWGPKGQPASRVYIDSGRRDAKVFLTFDDPESVSGCKLNVRIDDNGSQGSAWYSSQKQKLAEANAEAFIIALEVGEAAGAAEERAKFENDEYTCDLI